MIIIFIQNQTAYSNNLKMLSNASLQQDKAKKKSFYYYCLKTKLAQKY